MTTLTIPLPYFFSFLSGYRSIVFPYPIVHHVNFFLLNPILVDEVIFQEIADGNYIIVPHKPTIVSGLGAVPKADPQSYDLYTIDPCQQG